jgi:hypothetical protein
MVRYCLKIMLSWRALQSALNVSPGKWKVIEINANVRKSGTRQTLQTTSHANDMVSERPCTSGMGSGSLMAQEADPTALFERILTSWRTSGTQEAVVIEEAKPDSKHEGKASDRLVEKDSSWNQYRHDPRKTSEQAGGSGPIDSHGPAIR